MMAGEVALSALHPREASDLLPTVWRMQSFVVVQICQGKNNELTRMLWLTSQCSTLKKPNRPRAPLPSSSSSSTTTIINLFMVWWLTCVIKENFILYSDQSLYNWTETIWSEYTTYLWHNECILDRTLSQSWNEQLAWKKFKLKERKAH